MKFAVTVIVDVVDDALAIQLRQLRTELARTAMRSSVTRALAEVHSTADFGDLADYEKGRLEREAYEERTRGAQ